MTTHSVVETVGRQAPSVQLQLFRLKILPRCFLIKFILDNYRFTGSFKKKHEYSVPFIQFPSMATSRKTILQYYNQYFDIVQSNYRIEISPVLLILCVFSSINVKIRHVVSYNKSPPQSRYRKIPLPQGYLTFGNIFEISIFLTP